MSNNKYDKFENVINYENLYNAALDCKKGVYWKGSVIGFMTNLSENIHNILDDFESGTYVPDPLYKFTINERGTSREIQSQTIRDRVIHKCVCKYSLIPYLHPKFIYDNMASQSGKGTLRCMDRLNCHLQRYYRQYGTEGWILKCDIRKYFDSINHEYLYSLLCKYYTDIKLLNLFKQIIYSYNKGLGLGSEICQTLALLMLNEMDHIIKEDLKIKAYGRYMDDFYIIHPDKQYILFCKDILDYHLSRIGLCLHSKKTQIIPLSEGMVFLKFHFYLTNTGKVVRIVSKKNIKRTKTKLKRMKSLLDKNEISMNDIRKSYKATRGYFNLGNSYKLLQEMDKYFNTLFKDKLREESFINEL